MKLVKKRLIYARGLVGNDIYMFTANSVVKQDQKLVMGAGCARAVRDFYHGGQSVDEVLPLLETLPNNVIIYLDK